MQYKHVAMIESFVGRKFKYRAIPSGRALTEQRAVLAENMLRTMPEATLAQFKAKADKLRAELPGVDLVAAGLALLTYGGIAAPPQYSVLTGRKDVQTVKVEAATPADLLKARAVVHAALGQAFEVHSTAAGSGVVDVPALLVEKLVAASTKAVRFAAVDHDLDRLPRMQREYARPAYASRSSSRSFTRSGGTYDRGYDRSGYRR